MSLLSYTVLVLFSKTFTKGKLKLKLQQNQGCGVPRVPFNDLSVKVS